jgi:iron complex outermembrane receptor protein
MKLLSPVATLLLCSNIYADTIVYSLEKQSLKDAIEKVSKQSNIPYIAKGKLLEGKRSNEIKHIKGTHQALEKLLENSGLEALIEDGAIIIKQKQEKTNPQSSLALQPMTVTATTSPTHYLKSNYTSGALGNRSILDTPFSITEVDSNEILHRGAKTIGQIFANDPSVYTPFASSTTTWWGHTIRGLDLNNYYIDGVPISLRWGGDFPTEVTEKVSILKGLGGFMYGFGSPGGILSYTLKRPLEEPETALHLTYGNNSRFKEHIDTSFNITEDLGVRANIVNEHGTAYNESEADRQTYSLAVDKKFSDDLTWSNTFVFEKNTIESQPFHFYFWALNTSGAKLPSPTYNYEDINVDNSYYKTETRIFNTGLDWQINNQWNLNFQLGYSFKDQKSNRSFANILNSDGDYSGDIYTFASEEVKYLGHLMLQGEVLASGIEHNLVVGLGAETNKSRSSNESYYSNDFNGNIYENQTFKITRKADFSLDSATNKMIESSVFASDTLKFNENWSAIAGLRFINYENKDLDSSDGNSTYDTQEITPTLAVIFKPNPSTSFYVSYVESLDNGGPVGSRYANRGDILDPTISKQYEIGTKFAYDAFGGSVAFFRTERVNEKAEVRGGESYLTQDGLAIYHGIEVSTGYQFTNELRLGVGLTYLDASIEDASDKDTEGNIPAGVAKWQSVITAEYQPSNVEGLSFHGNVKYNGDRYENDSNILEIPHFTTVNAGFAYDFMAWDRNMTLTGNVNNLLNEKYWAGGVETSLGEARNFTLSLSTYF